MRDAQPRLKAWAIALLIAPATAFAQPPPDPMAVAPTMRAMIGLQYRISNPPLGVGVEFCPSARGRFKECKRLTDTKFTIEDAVKASLPGGMFRVRLDGGKTGFIPGHVVGYFIPADMDGASRDLIALCEKNGPLIGITSRILSYCWGQPSRINTTQTAAATREQWVYTNRGYIYVENGVVIAIQTSQ